MAPKIHCVRHAQGYHNLTPDNHKLPDPELTDLGKQQCADLQRAFPYHNDITHIVASPIKRTLWTALLGFGNTIAAKNLKVIALPELQETSDLPCDTGSSRVELEKEFAGQPVDLSRVDDGWNSKKGRWSTDMDAIAERARIARLLLRELASEHGEVVVVTHGGYLHSFTQDWSDHDKYWGTGWTNTEFRSYTFAAQSDDEGRLVELSESLERRHGVQLTEAEQLHLRTEAQKEWEAQGFQMPTKDPASGPAVKEVGLGAVKARA